MNQTISPYEIAFSHDFMVNVSTLERVLRGKGEPVEIIGAMLLAVLHFYQADSVTLVETNMHCFTPEIDIKNNRVNLHITSQLEDKLLQHQVLQASSMWVMANILKDYCLLSYSDYQKWKHNYPNINLFELVLGRKVDLETVFRTCQAFLDDQTEE